MSTEAAQILGQMELPPQEEVKPTIDATTTAPQAPVQDEKVASKLQVLVQREKKALELERKARERETLLEQRLREFEEREKKIKEFEELLETNPMKALESRGKSYKDLTQIALNDGNVPPELQIKKLEEKLDSQFKALEEEKRIAAEEDKRKSEQNEAQVIESFKGEINAFIDANPKKYELIQFDGQQNMIFEVIDEHYNRTIDPESGRGKVMTIAEAADKVNDWLKQKYQKATSLDTIKSLIQPQETKKQAARVDVNQFRPKPQRTLTNNLSATPQTPRTRQLTDDERVARAIAYAKGLRP